MPSKRLHRLVFLLLLLLVTLAFGWVLSPFSGAIFWAVVLALLFHGLYLRCCTWVRGRRNLAAVLCLLLVLVMVVVPVAWLGSAIAVELGNVSQRVTRGEISVSHYVMQVADALPQSLAEPLRRMGIHDLQGVIDKLSAVMLSSGQSLSGKLLAVGQHTVVGLVNLGLMLYLLFFFLRDGRWLAARIRLSVPLSVDQTQALLSKFATVVRATVKGTVVVALVQGVLGGLALAMVGMPAAVVWGALMALLSLVPAVGSALVWAPVAIYLMATGHIGQGLGLVAWGVLAIGMVDNLLRPILVGKDTKLPDWLVLLTTIGGISLLGISGFVIGPAVAALFMSTWSLFDQEGWRLANPSNPAEP